MGGYRMRIDETIMNARMMGCSDIHMTVGMNLMYRINGKLQRAPQQFSDEDTEYMIAEMLTDKQKKKLQDGEDADFAIKTPDGNRQRVNVFLQDGKLATTIRLLNSVIPSLEMLGLPTVLNDMADKPRGLILVTGPTGSGKSTTLAAMIDYINSNRPEHIITIEDPVEYVYEKKMALIHQREVGKDVKDFAAALRSALREDPDIILVGEMRDYETIAAALTAAETGHLVMSTLHTTGAAQTIDRIIDACPASIQNQIRTQLAGVLNGVITQCLIPNTRGNGRVAATEILVGTDAVCNLIRENKCHQMNSLMQSGAAFGMHTLNNDLSRLLHMGMITKQNAVKYSNDGGELEQYI
jgi:twitching motility protein PilT